MKSPIGQYYTTIHKAYFTDNFMRKRNTDYIAENGIVKDFSGYTLAVGSWAILKQLPGSVTGKDDTNILLHNGGEGNATSVDFSFTGVFDSDGDSPFLLDKFSFMGVRYDKQKNATVSLDGGTERGDLMFSIFNLHTADNEADSGNNLYNIHTNYFWADIIFTDEDFNVLPFTKLDYTQTEASCSFLVGVPNGAGMFRIHHDGTGPGYSGTLEV